MTKLPDHPQSQAEYQRLQQTCDVISLETRKLEAETGVGAEEKRVVSVPQDATMDEIVALDIFRMKLDTLAPAGPGGPSGVLCPAGLHPGGGQAGNPLPGPLGGDDHPGV